MRRCAALALLLVCGCGGRPAPGPVPQGWTRRTIEHAFTIDVPDWIRDEPPGLSWQCGNVSGSDPDASGRMEGRERRLSWSLYGPKRSYFSSKSVKLARRHPVWRIERHSAAQVNSPGHQFTDADSVQVTHILVTYRRRTVEATLIEPVPADTVTTRKLLGSIRILSDGE